MAVAGLCSCCFSRAWSLSASNKMPSKAGASSQPLDDNSSLITIDHLVYVVPDLQEAMNDMEEKTGVRPALGGKHTTLGTHNAFLALGDGRYIELFAPDPEAGFLKSLIGVDGGRQPRLSTFCCDAGAVGIDNLVARLSKMVDRKEYFPSSVEAGSRTNEKDGSVISWRIAVDKHSVSWNDLPMGGLLPFFIDWGEYRDIRPALTAPSGCALQSLTAHHPDATKLRELLNDIGSGITDLVQVKESAEPKLVATIETPKGIIELS